MKRLVWLMLLAFGTLLTQVPAVEPTMTKARAMACCGDCCHHAGKGSADCAKCAACAQCCSLAAVVVTGDITFTPLPAVRLESPAVFGRQLHYRPLLPPPRLV